MKKLLAVLFVLAFLTSAAQAAIPAGTVWELRCTAGSDTNGGGFTAGATGTDWSQQNSPQYSVTDGVTNGTTTVTSATANWGTDIPGNVCYIQGGTGSITAGWYQVASRTNATTIVVDRSTGLTTGTGVTINCGGALATPGVLASVMVSGNKAFSKATGTCSMTAGATFAGGTSGGAISKIIGYTSTRTDQGFSTWQASTNTGLTLITTSNDMEIRNLNIDCNSLGTCTGININGGTGFIVHNKIQKYASNGIVTSGSSTANALIYNNEVTGGTSSTGIGIQNVSSNAGKWEVIGNYVHDGSGSGIYLRTGGPIINNIVANMSGATADGIYMRSTLIAAINNIVYKAGRNGIALDSGAAANILVLNNILTDNGNYGFLNNGTAAAASIRYDGNAYWNNTTGNRSGFDDTTSSSTVANGINPYTNTHDIVLSSSPFVNASIGNFTLNNTGGGGGALRHTGLTNSWVGYTSSGYADFGPIQHQDGTLFQTSYSGGE